MNPNSYYEDFAIISKEDEPIILCADLLDIIDLRGQRPELQEYYLAYYWL